MQCQSHSETDTQTVNHAGPGEEVQAETEAPGSDPGSDTHQPVHRVLGTGRAPLGAGVSAILQSGDSWINGCKDSFQL